MGNSNNGDDINSGDAVHEHDNHEDNVDGENNDIDTYRAFIHSSTCCALVSDFLRCCRPPSSGRDADVRGASSELPPELTRSTEAPPAGIDSVLLERAQLKQL